MLKNIKNYINDEAFEMILKNKTINIINYKRIITISPTKVSVLSANQKIVVTGSNLTLNKLLESEILLAGEIKSIEVYDE